MKDKGNKTSKVKNAKYNIYKIFKKCAKNIV